MKLSRKVLIFAAAALIAGSGSYLLGRSNIGAVAQAVTTSRCSAGAFIHHSTQAGAVAADSETSDSVTPQTGSNPTQTSTAKTLGPNLIPNSGVEAGSGSNPTGWFNNVYGQNQAVFSRVPGNNSKSAVRTTISSYTNGDADWYYDAVDVTPGGYYQYSSYYRSNTSTRAVLMLKDTSGHVQYINLQDVGPASSWTKYQASFFVPGNVNQAMVFQPLAAKGFLDTDGFSLVEAQTQGFARPIVTLTFDDGWSSIHDNALPLLKQDGVVSTQYIISGYLGQDKDYMSPADVYDFQKSGSEVASHTVDHLDLTKQPLSSVDFELQRSRQDLSKCYGPATDFAAPYGTYNATTTAQIQKTYATARSTDAGFNTADNFNPYYLLVQNMTVNTTAAQLESWLETAHQNHAWLILVYHQIDNSGSSFSRHPSDFAQDLKAITASGIPIETVRQADTEVQSQAGHK